MRLDTLSSATHERLVLSISQLNQEVSQLLQQGFAGLWVEGEISNLARPASGHLYFSLKDAQAQVRCALFRPKAMQLNLKLENGLQVLAYGRVALYEPRGDYQFIIERLEAAGEGELQRRFNDLKQRLQAAGWFNPAHKKALPRFPRTIGVITSPSGAAIRDIIQVLQRRSPHLEILIYPVAVQGEVATGQIVQAIQQANREARVDVLILARGGGSLEDLWPFNEESVAQAVYNSQLPLISGVGHEIDFTIVDFVADQRAPTPSAAAELVSPDQAALQEKLQQLTRLLQQGLQRRLKQQSNTLSQLQQRLQLQRPARRLEQQAQRLDELELRLQRALQQRLNQARQQLHLQAARLQVLSPLATLDRGYALVFDAQGQVVKQASQVKPGDLLKTQFQQGWLLSRVESVHL